MVAPKEFITAPPQPTSAKHGHLSSEQVEQFFRDGFVQIDNFFDIEQELEPCLKATEELVEVEVAQRLQQWGRITDSYKDEDLFHRLTRLNEAVPGASVLMHKAEVMPKAYQRLWTSERLLNVMEQLIGADDIAGHPVWNLRPKTPSNSLHDVPWHQDAAYMEDGGSEVLQITCWIPFLDTKAKNGCLQVVKGGHRTGKVAPHRGCWKDTWYIWTDGADLEEHLGVNMETDVVTCEVPYGGVLMFSNLLPHRSLPNVGSEVRWSVDLRFQDATKPVHFYGLKEAILFKSKSNPNHTICWDDWNKQSRDKLQMEAMGTDTTGEKDFIIAGPWMKQWPIVNDNRHTAAFMKKGHGV